MPHIKVCGLTRPEDAGLAIRLGASFIGIILAAESPRRMLPSEAADFMGRLWDEVPNSAHVRPIGVFVNESVREIRQAIDSLGLVGVQIHGNQKAIDLESLSVPVIRAVKMKGPESHEEVVRARSSGPVLLDTHQEGMEGGTGKTFDHNLAIPHIRRGRVFIAGGLNPDNIAKVVQWFGEAEAMPYGFDVSSGLEISPGIKSPVKMHSFFANFKRAMQDRR
jgi:phosphoribosylanthranilate isomerase